MADDPNLCITIEAPAAKFGAAVTGRLRRAVLAVMHRYRVVEAEVHVRVIGDREMSALHAKYLGESAPTDVLTFDLGDSANGSGVRRRRRLWGDIVLSHDTAAREARDRGHGLAAELALYAVHGTLHLLGFGDDTPRRAAHMHRIEDDVLKELGWGPVFAGPARPKTALPRTRPRRAR